MSIPEDQGREKRRQDRIGGMMFVIGATVLSLFTIAAAVADRFSLLVHGGGLAVWAVMAILGVMMLRRGAEK